MKKRKIKRIAAVIACLLVLISVFVLPLSASPIIDDSNGIANGLVTNFVYNGMVYDYRLDQDPSFAAYEAAVNAFCADKEYTYTGYILGLESLAFGYVNPDLIPYPFDINNPSIRIHGTIDFSMCVNDMTFTALGASCDLYTVPSNNFVVFSIRPDSVNGVSREYHFVYDIVEQPPDSTDREPYYAQMFQIQVMDINNGEATEYLRLNRSDIENLYFTFSNGLTDDYSSYRGLLSILGMMFFGSYKGHFINPLDYYDGYVRGSDDLPLFYEAGYQQGAADIDSGEFGKNFLGAVFSAPFEMFNDFTLIEWTMPNGAVVSVTLATVISAAVGVTLFIWLLKVFAGG